MTDETVTKDLSRFGFRELKMAAELLTAYRTDKDATTLLIGDGLAVWMNIHSGYVFLCDEDLNTAMMSGEILEDFETCGYCGHEGVSSEVLDDDHARGQYGELVCREDASAWAEMLADRADDDDAADADEN